MLGGGRAEEDGRQWARCITGNAATMFAPMSWGMLTVRGPLRCYQRQCRMWQGANARVYSPNYSYPSGPKARAAHANVRNGILNSLRVFDAAFAPEHIPHRHMCLGILTLAFVMRKKVFRMRSGLVVSLGSQVSLCTPHITGELYQCLLLLTHRFRRPVRVV